MISFFGLARELRDQVYHYTLVGTALRFREGKLRFLTCYAIEREFTTVSEEKGNLKWMLASKQMLSEATEQFYRHAHCISYAEQRIQRPFPLFTLSKIKSISLVLELGFERTVNRVEVERIAVVPKKSPWAEHTDNDLKLLLAHIQSLSSTSLGCLELKTAIIDAKCADPGYVRDPQILSDLKRWMVDLSFLELLGKGLQQIDVALEAPELRRNSNIVEAHALAISLVQRELVRVSTALVADRGGWELKDWIADDEPSTPWRFRVILNEDGLRTLQVEHLGLRRWRATSPVCDEYKLQGRGVNGCMCWIGHTLGDMFSIRMPEHLDGLNEDIWEVT